MSKNKQDQEKKNDIFDELIIIAKFWPHKGKPK
jgi:hypothetical protein